MSSQVLGVWILLSVCLLVQSRPYYCPIPCPFTQPCPTNPNSYSSYTSSCPCHPNCCQECPEPAPAMCASAPMTFRVCSVCCEDSHRNQRNPEPVTIDSPKCIKTDCTNPRKSMLTNLFSIPGQIAENLLGGELSM